MIKSIPIKSPCCLKAVISQPPIRIRQMAGHPRPATTANVSLKTLLGAGRPYPEYQYTIQSAGFNKKLSRKYNHEGVAERFEDPQVRKSVEVDLAMIDSLNQVLKKLEWHIEKTARQHDYHTLYLLRSIPGVGQILALVILYEIHDIKRFPRSRIFPPMPG